MSLKDHLLTALGTLPGKRTFHIHTLTTVPRKHSSLYPFATPPRPKCALQDIIILCSEQSGESSPRVFVTAVEAALYHLPSTSSAILYVGKVDTTGQGIAPSPAATLAKALMVYYTNPKTRPITVQNLWVQLFARAQNQYLFPNSSEYSGKKPLNDVRLCAWWKRVFTSVADALDSETKLFYVLPGYSQIEAIDMMKTSPSPGWTYGHPYVSTLALPGVTKQSQQEKNLGNVIPWFEDDPKSRFLDDLACNTEVEGVKAPPPKRRKRSHGGGSDVAPNIIETNPAASTAADSPQDNSTTINKDKEKEKDKDWKVPGELAHVSADEFWERLSFRQECVSGAVTGFFTLVSTSPSIETDTRPQEQRGLVSDKLAKRVMHSLTTSVEFSTAQRAIRATEVVEALIRGLCQNVNNNSSGPPASDQQQPSDTQQTVEPTTLHIGGTTAEDPEMDMATYTSHIFGSIAVDNPALSVAQTKPVTPVTMLTVRKKKKKE